MVLKNSYLPFHSIGLKQLPQRNLPLHLFKIVWAILKTELVLLQKIGFQKRDDYSLVTLTSFIVVATRDMFLKIRFPRYSILQNSYASSISSLAFL